MENKTPRSELRYEIREKRLAYYGVSSSNTSGNLEKHKQKDLSNGESSGPRALGKKVQMSKSTTLKQSHEALEENMNNDLQVNCLNLDSVGEEIITARSLDTSRTSEILMETARDFREVLKDRETLRSKRSSKISTNAKLDSSTSNAAATADLTSRSVSEVLKMLEERASHRRRELPRLSDFSESDEEGVDPEPTSAEMMEKNDNFFRNADEWTKKFQFLCQDGRQESEYSPVMATKFANGNGSLTVVDNGGETAAVRTVTQKDVRLSDPDLMKQERELELQKDSILQKILASTDLSNGVSASGKSQNGDFRKSECYYSHLGKSDDIPARSSKANIAFSAEEIISQAEQYTSKGYHNEMSSKNNYPVVASVGSKSRTDQPQPHMRRSVHFDCPPTPSVREPLQKERSYPDLSSSSETKTSASVVSLMSIRDIADRLEQLGINPHLLGIELTDGQNRYADDKSKQKNKIRRLVKVCPECGKYNGETVSWCLTCSCVLIGIEPRPLPKRRHRGNRKRNSVSLSNSFDSSKESTRYSADLDSSNGSSVLGRSHSGSEDLHSIVSDVGSVSQRTGVSDYQPDSHISAAEVNQKSFDVTRSRETLPSSVYEDDVIDLMSPLATTERNKVSTPTAVWNPSQVNVAEIVKQSRALVDEREATPREESRRVPLSQPLKCDNTPRQLRQSDKTRNNVVGLMSTESTLSSISLATPSPTRPNIPNNIREDLKLDLTSSSVEDSQNSPLKKCTVDIAVLDHQDVLAMRENSTASQKPESVPGLPLNLSPSSSIGDQFHGAMCEDVVEDDVYLQEPHYDYLPEEPNGRTSYHRPNEKSNSKQKLRHDAKRRPASAVALNGSRVTNNRKETDVRRPLSSSQQPANRRRWKNSSQAWTSHHPSQLKKKPANYIVQESINASKLRDRNHIEKISYMQKNGDVSKQRNTNSASGTHAYEHNGVQNPKVYEFENNVEDLMSERDLIPQQPSIEEIRVDGSTTDVNYATKESDIEPLALHDNSLAFLHQRNSKCEKLSFSLKTNMTSRHTPASCPFAVVEPTCRAVIGKTSFYTSLKCSSNQHGWLVSKDSPWLYLADEVWLRIFKFLSPKDLSNCSATCKRLHRVANDSSLWRFPVVKRKHDLTEDELLTIGARRPISLKLKQCKGQNISLQGLKSFFSLCDGSLRKLCFSGCNHGAFSEDQFILLAAMFSPQLTSVDISFAHGVRDSTVRALAEECERLECVRLNGGQNVTDSSVKFLIETHGDSLRKLELYCCFGVSSDCVRLLGKDCNKLTHVSFGSCSRISSNALIYFASHRRDNLISLDLRGMHSVLDSTVTAIVAVCPNLESLALSNCGSVSNSSIRAIANHCPRLRKLDVCGCNQVGSDSAQELVRRCKHLEELDFSSTCVDHKTVTCLAHTWTPKLKCLRLNFCCNLKEDGLFKLCANSKSLSTLYLYGIRNFGVSVFNRIRKEYPRIDVKSDDSLEHVDP